MLLLWAAGLACSAGLTALSRIGAACRFESKPTGRQPRPQAVGYVQMQTNYLQASGPVMAASLNSGINRV